MRAEKLPSLDQKSGLVNALVEAPAGSRNKYKFNPAVGLYELHKVLPEGMNFPHDFGFVPSTRADDGDPIDVLILSDQSSFCGCLIKVRLIGVLKAEQKDSKGKAFFRNDRLIAVADVSVRYSEVHTINDVPKSVLDEIERFFVAYNETRGKQFRIVGRAGARQAQSLLRAAMTGSGKEAA